MFGSSKSSLRRTLALSALVLLTLVAPVVMAQDAEQEPNTEMTGSLSIMGFGLGDEIATTRVGEFERLYPNVELNFTEGGLDEQQFLTAVASGTPPDLVSLPRAELSTYAVRGALTPLTECIANEGIDMSQYRDVAVSEVTVDGEVYGIPEFFNNIMLIINTAALEEAGLTVDDVNTADWDSIAALNETLTRMDGDTLSRIGFDPKLPEFLPLWVAANGGQMLSDDGRTAMLNSPEVVEALTFAASLHDVAGGRAPFSAFRDTWDFFGSGNMIANDQLGVFPMEQWYMNVLADVSPDAPLAFKPFTDREGNPISFATGSAWAIPRGAANPEAACAFIKTVTSPEAWIAAAEERARLRAESGTLNTGTYTANRLADEVIFGEIVGPTGSDVFDTGVETILSLQENAFAIPANPAGAQFRQAWIDAVNRVLNGEQTVEEALNQAQQEAQAALDEAWAQSES